MVLIRTILMCTHNQCFNVLEQKKKKNNVKPLSDHMKPDIFLAFQAGGCSLLHESSAEISCMSFQHYFHSAISNHLSCHLNGWSLKTG